MPQSHEREAKKEALILAVLRYALAWIRVSVLMCYVKQGENRLMTLLKFFRYTCQGIAIASLGTLGVSGSWKALIEGLLMLFTAMALLHFEKKGDVQ